MNVQVECTFCSHTGCVQRNEARTANICPRCSGHGYVVRDLFTEKRVDPMVQLVAILGKPMLYKEFLSLEVPPVSPGCVRVSCSRCRSTGLRYPRTNYSLACSLCNGLGYEDIPLFEGLAKRKNISWVRHGNRVEPYETFYSRMIGVRP